MSDQCVSNDLAAPRHHPPVIPSWVNPDTKLLSLRTKRLIDVSVASMAIAVLLPLFALVAILIRVDSPGPIIFSQNRWGKGLRTIKVYKFRSMRVDLCDPSGVTQTTNQDERVTRVGNLLRRSNIDELPQLFNVLKGDMSLVGPRCHPIGMLAAGQPYEILVPEYHERHVMRPGLTGLAQVKGFRGPTVDEEVAKTRIRLDLQYINNFNLWVDVKILAATFVTELKGGKGF